MRTYRAGPERDDPGRPFLGIGMLVDNSVVVIENVYRLRSRGVPAARAAVQGTKQVGMSVVASTLTSVCVFLPVVFSASIVRSLMMPMSCASVTA
ncbi:MAG: efflux RND transporter permease subunit [Faecalibacterium prausnitzii]